MLWLYLIMLFQLLAPKKKPPDDWCCWTLKRKVVLSSTFTFRLIQNPRRFARCYYTVCNHISSSFAIRRFQAAQNTWDADFCDRWSCPLSVCLLRGRDVQKWLNGSTFCLWWRLLGTQETVYYMRVSIPHDNGSMRPLSNYFGHLFLFSLLRSAVMITKSHRTKS